MSVVVQPERIGRRRRGEALRDVTYEESLLLLRLRSLPAGAHMVHVVKGKRGRDGLLTFRLCEWAPVVEHEDLQEGERS